MPAADDIARLLDYLAERRAALSPMLVLTHDFPDPDAIASAVALKQLAESEFGIRARIAYGGVVGRSENRAMVRMLKLPVHRLRTGDIKRHASVALVDTQPKFRNNSFPSRMKASIVIDQHVGGEAPNAELAIVDTSCGATCALLAKALLAVGKPIPAPVATAITYGILTDTQSFLRTSRRDIVQVYLDILPSSDLGLLAEIQNPPQPRRFFTTLVDGIKSAAKMGSMICSHLGEVHYPEVVAEIADLLLSMRGVKWALCTGRYKGSLRISLRSFGARLATADVLQEIVAERGQAGGHDTIAGGSIRMGMRAPDEVWRSVEDDLCERLVKRLRIPRSKGWKYPFR